MQSVQRTARPGGDSWNQHESITYSNLLCSVQALVLQATPVSEAQIQLVVSLVVVVLVRSGVLEVRRLCIIALDHSSGLGCTCSCSQSHVFKSYIFSNAAQLKNFVLSGNPLSQKSWMFLFIIHAGLHLLLDPIINRRIQQEYRH